MNEIDELRREQAAAVMPHIGPLLDAWELLTPNDEKGALRESAPALCAALDAISKAVHSEPDEDGNCPAPAAA